MGLNLINAVIYVKYAGISEIRTVPFRRNDNYERSDTTIGDRRVLVTYSGVSCPFISGFGQRAVFGISGDCPNQLYGRRKA